MEIVLLLNTNKSRTVDAVAYHVEAQEIKAEDGQVCKQTYVYYKPGEFWQPPS